MTDTPTPDEVAPDSIEEDLRWITGAGDYGVTVSNRLRSALTAKDAELRMADSDSAAEQALAFAAGAEEGRAWASAEIERQAAHYCVHASDDGCQAYSREAEYQRLTAEIDRLTELLSDRSTDVLFEYNRAERLGKALRIAVDEIRTDWTQDEAVAYYLERAQAGEE